MSVVVVHGFVLFFIIAFVLVLRGSSFIGCAYTTMGYYPGLLCLQVIRDGIP